MPCSLCGEICRCSSEKQSTPAPRWRADPDNPKAEHPATMPKLHEASEPNPSLASEVALPSLAGAAPGEDSSAWRQEVAVRLNRYQSRRKPRPPRYPSLRLRFQGGNPDLAKGASTESSTFSQVLLSNQALARQVFAAAAPAAMPDPLSLQGAQFIEGSPALPSADEIDPGASAVLARAIAAPVPASVTAKIIEFPRSWTPPPVPLDELAEPVTTHPRILEAPEIVPPPPALGGITIEPAQAPELEKRPGIDIPLQSGPVARRLLSALIDTVIIAGAGALFAFIFWKLTAIRPPRLQMMGFLAGLSGLLWAAYQYLLVVHAGTTPGLGLAGLELTRFDGSPANRRLRRWRVLASYVSAISLGMGYGWVFLDEDALCWHDRITHTYLAVAQNRQQRLATPDRVG
jgi:uncharacterized RDD family membrane protein YckC